MKHFIPVIVWAIVILILSVTPSEELPQTDIKFADKWAHFLVYGLLSFLLLRNSQKYLQKEQVGFKTWSVLFLLAASYGILIEFIQHYLIPSRFGEWQDALANTIGVLFGLILGKFRYRKLRSFF